MFRRFGLTAGVWLLAAVPAAAHPRTITGSATAYAACDGSTTMTASGKRVRYGWAANNSLPLGTVIKILRPRGGIFVGDRTRRYFRIQDRGGPGFALDLWMSCRSMGAWGRRTVTFEVVSYG
jgi:3D (Asp-Asp-Asp) domain-containing protein